MSQFFYLIPFVGTIKRRRVRADVRSGAVIKEIAMADDVNKGADFNDDLHLLAGVVGLVALALMAVALWA